MAYEYLTTDGLFRLLETPNGWVIELGAQRSPPHASADAAIAALLSGRSGIPSLARPAAPDIPSDLARWTPTAEHL